MVRAILEGRKTMTRRVVKPQPGGLRAEFHHFDIIGQAVFTDGSYMKCPYGVPGDHLWVRETFLDDGETKERPQYVYRADNENYPRHEGQNWKPSIFMPRAASRILLDVTDVRVERLQDIKRSGAIAEGVGTLSDDFTNGVDFFADAVDAFSSLWQSINGLGSWDQNPWVWVVEFRKIEQE